jgi:hypothetical protein
MKGTNLLAGALATTLVISACSDTTGLDALDEALVLDMALVAADATLEDLAMWTQPMDFGGAPALSAAAAPGRPGGLGGISGEFSGTRSVTFFDAAGVEQGSYDDQTTASIRIVNDISGEVSRDDWTATIERMRDMTVTGLEGDESERIWNGSGTEEVSRSRVVDESERSHTSDGTFAYTDVVVPAPGSESRRPTSGTISRSMTVTVTRDGESRTRSVEILITFNGGDVATILINGQEMEIDLGARDGRNPIRRLPS